MADDLAALNRRWFEEVWNRGREEVIEQMVTPDIRVHGLGEDGRALNGPKEFHIFYHRFRSAFSELRAQVEDVIVQGNKCAARVTFNARHTGDGLGIPPTGRTIRTSAIVITHWKDGLITDAWNEFDAAGMMAQLTGPPPIRVRA